MACVGWWSTTRVLRHVLLCSVFPALQGIALDTCHLPMKYEWRRLGSLLARRCSAVSMFTVELPVGSPPDLYIRCNGDVTRQMHDIFTPTSGSHHFIARKWTSHRRHEECTCMDGLCLLDSLPCCRGHHVLQRTEENRSRKSKSRYMNNSRIRTTCRRANQP